MNNSSCRETTGFATTESERQSQVDKPHDSFELRFIEQHQVSKTCETKSLKKQICTLRRYQKRKVFTSKSELCTRVVDDLIQKFYLYTFLYCK